MKKQENKKTFKEREKRAEKILATLRELFPDEEKTMLDYGNTFELLVAVILSAQCTDARVNMVTKNLFKKYQTLKDYVDAKQEDFEKDIFSTGFYRNKAKNILRTAEMVQNEFGGKVPDTMQEILTLPGVARKTANVVLGNAYGIVEGIAVDTHVKRMSTLWGLTDETSPEKIEKDLMDNLPKDEWFRFTSRVIEYGRQYCPARKKDHGDCPLSEYEQ